MSDIAPYLANKILRWTAGNAMPSAPADVYLALYNGEPRVGGVEVTTTIRVAGRLALSFAALAEGLTNELDIDADVDFGAAAGEAALSHVAALDAAASGNLLWTKELPSGPYTVGAGTQVKFLAADVSFAA